MLVGIDTEHHAPTDGEENASQDDRQSRASLPEVIRGIPRLAWRTTVKSWDDSIIGWAAQAAFWQALSLPPLLLGVLGSLGYIADWFGPDTVQIITERIISFSEHAFTPNVVDDLIAPTVENVLGRGRVAIMSVSFVMSLWAGSSAMSCFVSSIVHAHGQHEIRHPVWQRIFALLIYMVFLVSGVLVLPLVALGPTYLHQILPDAWDPAISDLVDWGYFPFVGVLLIGALVTLYRFALPHPAPWHRLLPGALFAGVFFWVATYVLRFYLTALTRAGYTYGALATPIAFLLFTFFLGFAIVVGAELNASIEELWPAPRGGGVVRNWVTSQTTELTDTLRNRALNGRGSGDGRGRDDGRDGDDPDGPAPTAR
ncbi:tRNA processing ribonuclease BN [Gordonia sihwensis]|uniref:YihY/virulence factor BrkB family protein n=1 Tax=Gordonia sihwensis TaxID=173559 RepID=UPI001C93015C|nr:YihY/virulence factor BrkB family protein [Gordonia sihwensis]MBY4569711.1 tRNA processing ribonuclease BN [Gordonia sihwensis]